MKHFLVLIWLLSTTLSIVMASVLWPYSTAEAATIYAGNNSGCTLVNAVLAANDDDATGGCSAGNGDDLITFECESGVGCVEDSGDLIFETAYPEQFDDYGPSALPVITGNLIIDGGGRAFIRTGSSSLRFLVQESDELTIRNATIRNFRIRGISGSDGAGYNNGTGNGINGGVSATAEEAFGGAIYSIFKLTIDQVRFENNKVTGGHGGDGGFGRDGETGPPASGDSGSGGQGGNGGDGGRGDDASNAYGGVIFSTGDLYVSNSYFVNNTVSGGDGGSSGSGGDGGNGSPGNAAGEQLGLCDNGWNGGNGGTGGAGGNSGDAGEAGFGYGSALYVQGSLTMINSSFRSNIAAGGAAGPGKNAGDGGNGSFGGAGGPPGPFDLLSCIEKLKNQPVAGVYGGPGDGGDAGINGQPTYPGGASATVWVGGEINITNSTFSNNLVDGGSSQNGEYSANGGSASNGGTDGADSDDHFVIETGAVTAAAIHANQGHLEFVTISYNALTVSNNVDNDNRAAAAIEKQGLSELSYGSSIIAHNSGAQPCSGSNIVSQGGNLLSQGGCGTSAAGDLSNTDPLLDGFTQLFTGTGAGWHPLTASSPAIDIASCNLNYPIDQTGQLRVDTLGPLYGAACEAGAVEYTAGITPEIRYKLEISFDNEIGANGLILSAGNPALLCPSLCDGLTAPGTVVELTALPNPGTIFVGWSGDSDCSDGMVTMNADINCIARFEHSEHYNLGITFDNEIGAHGLILSTGIAVLLCPGLCDAVTVPGALVDFTVLPNPGSVFAGWSGDSDCSDGMVTMTADIDCIAHFELAENYDLSVDIINLADASGQVTTSPAALNCPGNCSGNFLVNTSLSLLAKADPGSFFSGWSGESDCLDGQVDMTIDLLCTATFVPSSSIQPGAVFMRTSDQIQPDGGALFLSSASDLLFANEINQTPVPDQALGPILTFPEATDGNHPAFSIETLEPGGPGWVFEDTIFNGSADNALSVNRANDGEDDDFVIRFDSGVFTAFGMTIVHNNPVSPGIESIAVYGAGDVLLAWLDLSTRDFSVSDDIQIAIHAREPIASIVFDEDPTGDDIAIKDFYFGYTDVSSIRKVLPSGAAAVISDNCENQPICTQRVISAVQFTTGFTHSVGQIAVFGEYLSGNVPAIPMFDIEVYQDNNGLPGELGDGFYSIPGTVIATSGSGSETEYFIMINLPDILDLPVGSSSGWMSVTDATSSQFHIKKGVGDHHAVLDLDGSGQWTSSTAGEDLAIELIARNENASSSSIRVLPSSGSGAGTVTASTGDIDCGITCYEFVSFGTTETLTFVPAANSYLEGFDLESCTFLSQTDRSVTFEVNFACKVTPGFVLLTESPILPQFCRSPGLAIPDANATGVTDSIVLEALGFFEEMEVLVQIDHSWVGDLEATLTFENTFGTYAVELLDRPGFPASGFGCSGDNINLLFADGGPVNTEIDCSSFQPAISGVAEIASGQLTDFLIPELGFTPLKGRWTLKLSDNSSGDTGELTRWCVVPREVSPSILQTVTPAGAGTGRIYDSGTGGFVLDCGDVCSAEVQFGSYEEYVLAPDPGFFVDSVTPADTCVHANHDELLRISSLQNTDCTVYFDKPQITVSTVGDGFGQVLSTPAGIDCGLDCNAKFDAASNLTLLATPTPGSIFSEWYCIDEFGVEISTAVAAKQISMNAHTNCQASFTKVSDTGLTVDAIGKGRVQSSPAGIDCYEQVCEAQFPFGQSVTLTAIPDAGHLFLGWEGSCASGTVLAGVVDQCEAIFLQKATLSVALEGNGRGVVFSNPPLQNGFVLDNIDCGLDCELTTEYAVSFEMQAIPRIGSRFTGWSGSCNVSDPLAESTQISMTGVSGMGDQSCVATFKVIADPLFCRTVGQTIPDNDPIGLNADLSVIDSRILTDLNVYVDIEHAFVGDLVVTLESLDEGTIVTLIDRPGFPDSPYGCFQDDIVAMLNDEASFLVESRCELTQPTIEGYFKPQEALSAFDGVPVGGNWRLNVSDHSGADLGTLATWCLLASGNGPEVSLQINLAGTGMGQVTSTPVGINCPASDCSATFTQGTVVNLSADASLGSVFSGWSANCPDGQLTIGSASASCTAEFTIDTYELVYSAASGGSINGTSPQTADYGADGTEVTAVADDHYRFVDWSDGVVTASRIDLNVKADLNVIANFAGRTGSIFKDSFE